LLIGGGILLGFVALGALGASRPNRGTASESPQATRTSQPSSRPTPTAVSSAAAPSSPATSTSPAAASPPGTLPQDFAPISLSGRGDDVVEFAIPESAAAIASFTHAGDANFAVWTVGSGGEQQELLVNEIGNYAGTLLFDLVDHSVAFDITADGAWTSTVRPLGGARVWNGQSQLTGRTDDVVQIPEPLSGLTVALVIHDGDANFALVAYSAETSELLVNEIGPYRAEQLLPDGTLLLQVTANGPWSVTPQ
jgi:hypothetical protein